MKTKLVSFFVAFMTATLLAANSSDFFIADNVLIEYKGIGGDVIIPSTVTEIGDDAFKDCAKLKSILIPNTVKKIGKRAFMSCWGLSTVDIPNSVTSIGDHAFYRCAIFYYEGLTSVTLGNSVKTIGRYAFGDCFELSSIDIPASVTSIGDYAFAYCKNLNKLTIPWTSLSSISISDLTFVTFDLTACTLEVPSGCLDLYKQADIWKDFGTIVEKNIQGVNDDKIDYGVRIEVVGNILSIHTNMAGRVIISDLSGKIIVHKSIEVGETLFQMNKGLYLVKIDQYTQKVIIE